MRRGLPIAILVILATPSAAQAFQIKDLWATVNICDPPGARNVIGVRASMPRNGPNQRMFMRFYTQWFDGTKRRWVASGSTSRWMRVRTAGSRPTQVGFSFQFADPPRGTQFLMRGVVNYQWRAPGGKRVVRRATRVTKRGQRGVGGGIPPGRSDTSCIISF